MTSGKRWRTEQLSPVRFSTFPTQCTFSFFDSLRVWANLCFLVHLFRSQLAFCRHSNFKFECVIMLHLFLTILVLHPSYGQSDQSVISSFHPDTPSPTRASPPLRSGVRFIDQDATPQSANPFQEQESYFAVSAPTGRRTRILADYIDSSASEINTEFSSQSDDIVEDRWRWPSRPDGRREQRQSPEFAGLQSLDVHRSVLKPYRIHSKESSCPKLLHDLSISCQLPDRLKQHQDTVVNQFSRSLLSLFEIV